MLLNRETVQRGGLGGHLVQGFPSQMFAGQAGCQCGSETRWTTGLAVTLKSRAQVKHSNSKQLLC